MILIQYAALAALVLLGAQLCRCRESWWRIK